MKAPDLTRRDPAVTHSQLASSTTEDTPAEVTIQPQPKTSGYKLGEGEATQLRSYRSASAALRNSSAILKRSTTSATRSRSSSARSVSTFLADSDAPLQLLPASLSLLFRPFRRFPLPLRLLAQGRELLELCFLLLDLGLDRRIRR
jgi:hypothetical protein